jgi:hypothetical protein
MLCPIIIDERGDGLMTKALSPTWPLFQQVDRSRVSFRSGDRSNVILCQCVIQGVKGYDKSI